MANAVIGSLRINLGINSAAFSSGLKDAQGKLAGFGKSMSKIGAGLSLAVTTPIIAMGAGILKTAGDFEGAMSRVGAATGASAGQMKSMASLARELGKSTVFSARESADAMEVLAKNGLNIEQILGGATQASLDLAAATGSDMAGAADVATDVMLSFGKATADMGKVVDGITGTLLESKFGFEDYRLAIGQAGGAAGALGVEFEDFNAALVSTAHLFTSGSDAGTSFKTFLQKLVPTTIAAENAITKLGLEFFDAQGNMKSMADIAEELRVGLNGLSEESKIAALKDIFGTDAMRTAIGLASTTAERFRDIQKALSEASGEEQAAARLGKFNAAMEQLSGAFEELQISIAESGLLEFMTNMVSRLSDLINRLSETNPALLKWGAVVAGLGAVVGPVLVSLGLMAAAIGAIGLPVTATIAGVAALTAVLVTLGLRFSSSEDAALVWAANLDAASQRVALSTVRNISIAIAALDNLRRAQASITPLEGDSPFTIDPGTDRIGNAIAETEKLIRLEKIRLEGQREHAGLVKIEADDAKNLAAFTSQVSSAIGDSVAPASSLADYIDDAAGSSGGGGGGATKLADELERAHEVLNEQLDAYGEIRDQLTSISSGSSFVADEARQLNQALKDSGVSADAFLRTVGLTHDEYLDMLRDTERLTDELEKQESLAQSIGDAFTAFGKGILQISSSTGGITDALGGIAESITETIQGPFVEKMGEVFKTLGDRFAKTLQNIGGGAAAGPRSLLSSTAISAIGSGIGLAASGALQGSSQAIGSGIGQAAGAAIGTLLGGPIGTVLGGLAGGFIGSLFGQDEESPWKRVSGTAFTGTTFAQNVTTEGRLNTATDQGFAPEARLAFQGVKAILADFNTELAEFVESTGGEVRKGTDLIVDQASAIKRITGALSEDDGIQYKAGKGAKEQAEAISKRVSEVMALAAAIVQEAGPPLTQAQVLWRETQERFSEENIAILKDLGFAAKQISEVQRGIKRDLREGFEGEIVQGLIDTGRATRREMGKWKELELSELDERRKQAIATAKEIGASVSLVRSLFRAERREVQSEYKELLDGLVKETKETTDDVAGEIARRQRLIANLQNRINRIDGNRSEILRELVSRVEDARNAEQTLLDARRSLASSGLAPGGPTDQFKTLRDQFAKAIEDARGGDADAAGRAAGLASELLESGRGIFASGSRYAELFKQVNQDLLKAQRGFDSRGDRLKKQLDASSMNEISERSTKALLTALGKIDKRLEHLGDRLENQQREQRIDQQRRNAGRGA